MRINIEIDDNEPVIPVNVAFVLAGRGWNDDAEPGSLMDTHGIAYNRESYFR